MAWTIVLDILMAVLLAASIATSVILNRRLERLRADRADLERLSEGFRAAMSRADAGVAALKVSADALQQRMDNAQTLADDLEFLIERGGGVADRLEVNVRTARRTEARVKDAAIAGESIACADAGRAERPQPKPETPVAAPRSAAERHLLAALRARG